MPSDRRDHVRYRDLVTGGSEVVGIAETDEPDAYLKVYVDSRWLGRYVLIYDEDAAQQIRDRWAGPYKLHIPYVPDDALHYDEEATADAA